MGNNTVRHIINSWTSLGHQRKRWCPRLLCIITSLTLSGCHGVLDGLYDEAEEEVVLKEGQLYVDASSWTDWYYIDLNAVKDGVVKMGIPIGKQGAGGLYTYWYDVFGEGLSNHEFRSFTPMAEQPEPESWHLAVHRNNVRTNGGAAYETSYTSMDALPESSEAFKEMTFTEDTWNELDVWAVRGQMLNGLIGNQGIEVNPVLSKWLNVSIPPMPPAFTLNNHVFIVRFSDGTYAALQLENYVSTTGTKCCLTINYKYPY